MAMKFTNWNISQYVPETARRLEAEGYPKLVAALLSARGVKSAGEARELTCCSMEDILDPMLMRDMDKAAARVREAVRNREHAAVFGDYDVDGITSTCLLVSWLREKGLTNCEMYIPDREDDGYGLNPGALDKLRERGVTLTITVDCGITACLEARHAAEIGMDLIITDHHECRESIPEATAVVDPKRGDCGYPYKSLAGVGVAFKLVCAAEGTGSAGRLLEKYGDLLAVGTVADVMPVTGENRIFIQRGLEILKTRPRPGFAALMRAARIEPQKVGATAIGYTLAPRINAAGRMGSASVSAELILSEEPEKAAELAEALSEMNKLRQKTENRILTEALSMLEDGRYMEGEPIVLAREGWHQGVIGIVASRLAERFHVPAVMICLKNGQGKGSCRSYGQFNLFAALESVSELLEGFGGHELAAGLTILEENVPEMRRRFREKYTSDACAGEEPALKVDMCIFRPELLTEENVETLDMLEPCGVGNPRPVFCIRSALLTDIMPIGGGKHTRLRVEKWGYNFECVFFGQRAEKLEVRRGENVDIAFVPQINEFRGRRTVQLLMTDIRPAQARNEREVFKEFFVSGDISPEDAYSVLPERRDFVALWKRLASGTAPGRAAGKDYICLKVFQELGLIKLSETGEKTEVEVSAEGKKVDLGSSIILRRLTEAV